MLLIGNFSLTNFSIIICAHNPNDETFIRLLKAINFFDSLKLEFEVIIVDNNSKPSLSSFDCIGKFVNQQKNAFVINESTPGLTAARMCGIKKAKYEWLVFFDDDNEPCLDYLLILDKSIKLQNRIPNFR